ncbi:MAG: hypothetical protein ACOYOT_01805 [Bacteroidales bacterium]
MKTKLFVLIFLGFSFSVYSQDLSNLGESILKNITSKPHIEYDTLRAIRIISKTNNLIRLNSTYNPSMDGYPLNEIDKELPIMNFVYKSKTSSNRKNDIKYNERLLYYINQLENVKGSFNQYIERKKIIDKSVNDSLSVDIKKKEELQYDKEKNKSDSTEQYKITFFSPQLIAKVVGMPNATKQNLESEYHVELLGHRGGWDYYDFNKTQVGFKFGGNSNVCYKLTFRLFGDEALEYESQIKNAGFKLLSRKESSNLELEGDLSSKLLNGEVRIYKMGSVICHVYDGSYIGFTFYRFK